MQADVLLSPWLTLSHLGGLPRCQDPHLYKQSNGSWRLLFHQYTLGHVAGNKTQPCPAFLDPAKAGPDPSWKVVGGKADSLTADIAGDWVYNYWG